MLTLNLHPFPILTTERLVLRAVEETDAEAVFALRSDATVMQYVDRPLFQSINEAQEMVAKMMTSHQNNESINWAVTLKGNPELIGTIGYWRIEKEHHRAEIGYTLKAAHHGQGIMHESLAPVLHYAFHNMRLHSIEANINPYNQASLRLLEKNGFVKEAHFKENYYYDGKFLDSVIYSLLTPI